MLKLYEKQLNKGIRREEKKTQIALIPITFGRLLPDLAEGRGDIAAAKTVGSEPVQHVRNVLEHYIAYALGA